MNHYYITGASRGIGKAIAEALLKNENNKVTGISRTNSIVHERYTHVSIDLSDIAAVQAFRFSAMADAGKLVLINNAGAMSDVKHMGNLDSTDIIRDYHIDLVAPALLMNHFIAACRDRAAEKIIVNVSSGAGKRPIDGWGVYCSSKAALDMLSRVVADEQWNIENGCRVFSVAPGIVDTQMQTDIRRAVKEDFSRIDEFINYKQSGQLADPAVVAEKYLHLIDHPEQFPDVVLSVSDI